MNDALYQSLEEEGLASRYYGNWQQKCDKTLLHSNTDGQLINKFINKGIVWELPWYKCILYMQDVNQQNGVSPGCFLH